MLRFVKLSAKYQQSDEAGIFESDRTLDVLQVLDSDTTNVLERSATVLITVPENIDVDSSGPTTSLESTFCASNQDHSDQKASLSSGGKMCT